MREDLKYVSDYLDDETAEKLYQSVLTLNPQSYKLEVFGKVFNQPRLTAWCNDDGKGYPYSGQITPAVSWTDKMLECRRKLEEEFDVSLPTCLVNVYRDGRDSVGFHRDDESIFGPNPAIFTISLGATRKFKLKNNQTKDKKDFELKNGDLLYFSGEYARDWVHSIPKTARQVGQRISLTYRTID